MISHYRKTTFARYFGKDWMLVSKHADIKGIVQLKNSKDEKPERTLIFIHPPIQPRPPVNLKSTVASNKIANIAIKINGR